MDNFPPGPPADNTLSCPQKEESPIPCPHLLPIMPVLIGIGKPSFPYEMIQMEKDELQRIPSRLPKIGVEIEQKGGRGESQLMKTQAQVNKIKLGTVLDCIDYRAAFGTNPPPPAAGPPAWKCWISAFPTSIAGESLVCFSPNTRKDLFAQ